MKPSVSYKEHLLKRLQDDPKEVVAYLNAALEEDDPHVFLLALRDVAEAKGGIGWLSDETDLNRVSLYRTLSFDGNPRFMNFLAILQALNLNLSIDSQAPAKNPRKRKSKSKTARSASPRKRGSRSRRLRA